MKRELQTKLNDFLSAGNQLLEAWYAVEANGDEVPVIGYPFTESFEEVLANLGNYKEFVDQWANA